MIDIRSVRASAHKTAVLACMAAVLILGTTADARVTRIVFGAPSMPYGSTSFGAVGQYQELDGTAYGELDPKDPANAVIQDIQLAPRNARGMVEYQTVVSILMPVNISAGNHAMLFEIVNRGNKLDPTTYNVGASGATATAPPNPGDGFLEQQGFTLVWAGWQSDLTPASGRVTMTPVIAHLRNGGHITGPVRSEFIVNAIDQKTGQPGAPVPSQPILADSSSNTLGYATAHMDNLHDTLTMRAHQTDAKVVIPNSDWVYADCSVKPFPGTPSAQHVCLRNGFDTDHIYELVYTAQDPIVMGLGLAAIRDVGAFLRHEKADDVGTANPLYGHIQWTLLNGISQSGRLLRTFLELGFNRDEKFGRVFDGMQPHIGSVRNYMNVRFAQPGRLAGTQHTEKQYPGPEGPLSYGRSYDPFTREESGVLDACERTNTCPKIVHTMSDIEYWEASGAFDTVDPRGEEDLDIPWNVRIYQFSSTQHGGFSPAAPLPTTANTLPTTCEQLTNANSYTYNIRALLMALYDWVAKNEEPPPSAYSTLRRGTLVHPNRLDFPHIPNVTGPEGIWNTRQVFRRGDKYDANDVSGIISIEPPVVHAEYPTLLPQVDEDGNDLDGLRSVTLRAPLGTYTGWNVRRAGFSGGDACDLNGGYIPFALTHAQREMSGDPRRSLQERYGSLANYTAIATEAAHHLVHEGYLLQSDETAAISSAVSQAQQAGLQ